MTHANVELTSMLADSESRRLKSIAPPVELPHRPGPVRRSIGRSLISLGEHIGGAHLRRMPAPVPGDYQNARLA